MSSFNNYTILLLVFFLCPSIFFVCQSAFGGAVKLVTMEELKTKTGEDDTLIWLSLLGKVYDVTEGKDYYGPGESYNSLCAKDSSVPFITGTFTPEEALKDPVELSDSDLKGLIQWQQFYADNDKYHLVGKLLDERFYDSDGNAQPSLVTVLERIEKHRQKEEEEEAAKKERKAKQ